MSAFIVLSMAFTITSFPSLMYPPPPPPHTHTHTQSTVNGVKDCVKELVVFFLCLMSKTFDSFSHTQIK